MMQDQSELTSEAAAPTIKQLNNSSIQSSGTDGIGSLTKQTSLPREEGSSGGGGSGSSSPEPPEPWTPRYTVIFSEKVVKNGSAVTFTILVGQDDLTIQVLERVYEDFEYLEHCVATDQPSDGLILPPLPPRPTTDAAVTETHSKKHMGKGSKTLLGDNFQKDRLQLQKYLELLLAHPVLGRSQRLESFLTVKEAPPRAKIKRGLLWKLSDSFETRRTAVPDCEEFFQRERAWLTRALPLVVEFDTALHSLIFVHQRLLVALEGVVTALRLTAGPASTKRISGDTTALTTTTARVGMALEAIRFEGEATSKECESVVGGGVELWRRHLEAEGAMLQRRTALLLNYQHCNRALDRAKPNRRQAAEVAKKEAEEAFEACSDVARHEIKRLHRVRDSELTTLFYHYGRLQLDAATRQHATLAATLAIIKGEQAG